MTEITALALLGRILPSLGLILGGLLLVKWWAQRERGGRAEAIRVTSRTGIARNTSLAVVEVGEQRFLIGMTESNVQLISELDAPAPVTADAPDETPTERTLVVPELGDLVALRASTDRMPRDEDVPSSSDHDNHPRTGLVARMQRATARRTEQTSWQRVDDVLTG